MRFDPAICSFFNSVYDGIQELRLRLSNIDDYLIVINVLHYSIPIDHIFGLQVIHQVLDPETTFILTKKQNLDNIKFYSIIQEHKNMVV